MRTAAGAFATVILMGFLSNPVPAQTEEWPVLKVYDRDHLDRIALPLGGIGTGTVSLGGRGDLRDWEIMNRPAKGYIPNVGERYGPFFAIFTRSPHGDTRAKVLEGPLPLSAYENSHGSTTVNHGLPRFRECEYAAAYPLAQIRLSDPDMPVRVRLMGFNPLIPGDAERSGLPLAVLRFEVRNTSKSPLQVTVCGSLPNFIGRDGSQTSQTWTGDRTATGGKDNLNVFRSTHDVQGIFMTSSGVNPKDQAWGTIALTTSASETTSHRVSWLPGGWGTPFLDFWDDFSRDGTLDPRKGRDEETPMASLAVTCSLEPGSSREITFLLAWHFPNRYTWTPDNTDADRIGNYYTTRYRDAWDVAERTQPELAALERKTLEFVTTFCASSLPDVVKEAALFNISTLRTQTCFRTPDGRFFYGSCTHVWNYEQATAFLFGELARSMRDTEFMHATDQDGLMSFRVGLPLERAQNFGKAAADGQMGCLMKLYRDWQLSGDDDLLKRAWPAAKRALEFCWIPGGWDADRDGVMEGAQHNTMDVEYYGPNPQMGIWYLGALRAMGEMARYLGEDDFAETCRRLSHKGRDWVDQNLFNGEYYIHRIKPPQDKSEIAPSLLVGMGAADPTQPDYQLGEGCLVDQLVGQFVAHVCGLGHLTDPDHVRSTLRSILKYNGRQNMFGHFNCMRSFVLGDESALLMASYPKARPRNPFPYFTEVMTGFEYTAAVGMLYEGQRDEGLGVIRNIRDRYDGRKRNPFDEAECGHHYARAMASWAAVLALSGFQYSGVSGSMVFAAQAGNFFWSTGDAWGNCRLTRQGDRIRIELDVRHGKISLKCLILEGFGSHTWDSPIMLCVNDTISVTVNREGVTY
jgi:non-lysosomal glucosylceramidase